MPYPLFAYDWGGERITVNDDGYFDITSSESTFTITDGSSAGFTYKVYNSNGELIVDSSDSYYVGFDIPFDSTYYYVFKHDNSWEEIQRYYL